MSCVGFDFSSAPRFPSAARRDALVRHVLVHDPQSFAVHGDDETRAYLPKRFQVGDLFRRGKLAERPRWDRQRFAAQFPASNLRRYKSGPNAAHRRKDRCSSGRISASETRSPERSLSTPDPQRQSPPSAQSSLAALGSTGVECSHGKGAISSGSGGGAAVERRKAHAARAHHTSGESYRAQSREQTAAAGSALRFRRMHVDVNFIVGHFQKKQSCGKNRWRQNVR